MADAADRHAAEPPGAEPPAAEPPAAEPPAAEPPAADRNAADAAEPEALDPDALERDALVRGIRSGVRVAVLSDFDGTLAGIVEDPDRAAPVPGALAILSRLVERYQVVGVISGRPVRFLMDRLGRVEGLLLAGLYGLEQAVGDRIDTLPEALPWAEPLEAAARDAESTAPLGVRVERKGLALTLHVRTAPSLARWIEDFGARQVQLRGLEAHPGRQSVELRPPVRMDKGTVVEAMGAGCDALCYCGDDRGDLPAFAALQRLRARGVATLSVAAASDESPPELTAAADVTVDGPLGVVKLLSRLVS